ncbi:MAG TPA: hypothetical protein VGW39_14875 [Chthoniobacterales bacterium]|nr:hypothetical protein [Chthoniobacterales bacterium]
MTTPRESLEGVIKQLVAGKPLNELDYELLAREIAILDVDKYISNPLFDSDGAGLYFRVLPLCKAKLAERRLRLQAWITSVLRPPNSNQEGESFEEEKGSLEALDTPSMIARLDFAARTSSEDSVDEVAETAELLTQPEEEKLFAAYNYARYKLARHLPNGAHAGALIAYPVDDLLQLAQSTLVATEMRDLLIEFHYRFVVKCAHKARWRIGGNVTVRDMFLAGIEGLRKAINTYDSRRGASRLVGYASTLVNAEIIDWFKKETQWTSATTRPVKNDDTAPGSDERVKRERIPLLEIEAALREKGAWTIFNEKHSSEEQPAALTGGIPLRDDPLKLDKFLAVAQVRKAAATAAATAKPIVTFKNLVAEMASSAPYHPSVSVEAAFAPPDWQVVWQRRVISLAVHYLG